jgi:type IV pilus assembly protein PilZ
MSESAAASQSRQSAETPSVTAPGGAARPSVMSLAIRDKAGLASAYMPFVQGGGLFVPTTRQANLGDDLYLIMTLLDDPAKYAVPGKVVWITPAGTTGRPQGLGIQFARNEAGEQVRARFETLIGSAALGSRKTNTL